MLFFQQSLQNRWLKKRHVSIINKNRFIVKIDRVVEGKRIILKGEYVLKKLANFLVNMRYLVFGIMLVITILCVFLQSKVNINTDMTKYLSNDSQMKQGMDIMDKEFPVIEESNTIRVMFTGLPEKEQENVLTQLEKIPYVDGVTYDAEDKDCQKTVDGKTYSLFTITTTYAFGTKEELSIEKAVVEHYDGQYNMIYSADSGENGGMPAWFFILAVVFLFLILFLMCHSIVEPFLFMVTIGMAVLINMGTNAFLPSVSNTTHSIAAILQLALSMDYSIILMNWYRQEKSNGTDKVTSMKTGLLKGFGSIISSSITTVVGLLTLVFMSFKIGADMGIVLAKGVFISLFCIFTILPALILFFDKAIEKTEKPVLSIPMKPLSRFSNAFRKIAIPVFLIVFAAATALKGNTDIIFSMTPTNEIDEVFAPVNTLVLVYENEDEENITKIADNLVEEDDKVKNATNYSNTLGKEYNVTDMVDVISKMSDSKNGLDINADILSLLYYDYYKSGETKEMTVSEFLTFLADDVVTNQNFADQMDKKMLDNIDTLTKFADVKKLTRPMNATELASFFDMNKADVSSMLLYYYTEKGGIQTGKMTLSTFVDFILNDLAKDKTYSSMFDAKTLESLKMLQSFTDKENITKKCSYQEMAKLLSMDAGTTELLYVYYYAQDKNYTPAKMTLPEFVTFLNTDVVTNQNFASQFDAATKAQLQSLAVFTNKKVIEQQRNAAELAPYFSMKQDQVEQLLGAYSMLHAGEVKTTMSMLEFVNYLLSEIVTNPNFSAGFDKASIANLTQLQGIMYVTEQGQKYSFHEMTSFVPMDTSNMKMLFTYHDAVTKNTKNWKLSTSEVVDFILKNQNTFKASMGAENLAQLSAMQKMMQATIQNRSFTSKEMASLTSMDNAQIEKLYMVYVSKHGDTSSWKLTVKQFMNFLNEDVLDAKDFADKFDSSTKKELKLANQLINAVVKGDSYSPARLYKLLKGASDDLSENIIELIYLYHGSVKHSDPNWTMSIDSLFHFLADDVVNDTRFTELLNEDFKENIVSSQKDLDDGMKQLKGDKYSRLIINTHYEYESPETNAFMKALHEKCDSSLSNKYYIIGNSAMNYEMSLTFKDELNSITLITALAIFVVVAITFQSIIIPLILVLLIQFSVYATVISIGVQGYSIHYLALLIVQSILMGATIDYGILYTTYYCRYREEAMEMKEALLRAYDGAIHTILTSGLILIIVTAIMSYAFPDPSVSQICRTISKGALCSVLLILFVLPGMLAAADRFIIKKKK